MDTSPPSPVDMLKTLGQIPESAFSTWERGFIADQRRNLTRGSLSEKQYTRLTEIYTERCVTTTAQTPDPEQPPPGEYCPLCHDSGMVHVPPDDLTWLDFYDPNEPLEPYTGPLMPDPPPEWLDLAKFDEGRRQARAQKRLREAQHNTPPQPTYARCRCVNDNPVIGYRVGMRKKHKASGRV